MTIFDTVPVVPNTDVTHSQLALLAKFLSTYLLISRVASYGCSLTDT